MDANITGRMPAAEAAATILLRLLDTVEANVPGVLARHRHRVPARPAGLGAQVAAALKLFGDALTAPLAAPGTALTGRKLALFAAEFKWVGDLTTPTRDLDVHLLDFEDTARDAARREAGRPGAVPRVPEAAAASGSSALLARGLRSPRFVTLTRDWRERLTAIRDSANAGTAATVRSGQSRRAVVETTGTLAAEQDQARVRQGRQARRRDHARVAP